MSSNGGAVESDQDPFVEKRDGEEQTPKQRLSRMALHRTYSKPTYPTPSRTLEQTDLAPY